MKAGSGSGWWRMSMMMAVDGKQAASSPVVVSGGEAIAGRQWTMTGKRNLVGGRIIY
jgi:hypothetical protein